MFSAAIATTFPHSGVTTWTGMSVAPIAGGGCNIAYQTAMYVDDGCSEARTAHFPTFSNRSEFGEAVEAYTDESGAATLYLLPAGEGCMAIKHEVLY